MSGTDIIGLVLAGMMAFVWWQVRKNQGSLRTALYKKDGISVYVTKGECKDSHVKLDKSICDKFDGFRKDMKEMDGKRELARREDSIWKEKMSRALGRIEGMLENHT
ncbi:MAG: hypothetical protein JRG81_00090 [Deltaproteobacteria bacterium]|nr:hypothetical protein [Deltaproteobacteria bacterium]MBW2363476.1 hypothetical protein [Deltaproteobacteria bacterium]